MCMPDGVCEGVKATGDVLTAFEICGKTAVPPSTAAQTLLLSDISGDLSRLALYVALQSTF